MQKLNDLQLRIIERGELIKRGDRYKLTIEDLVWWISRDIDDFHVHGITIEKHKTYIWYLEQLREQGYE